MCMSYKPNRGFRFCLQGVHQNVNTEQIFKLNTRIDKVFQIGSYPNLAPGSRKDTNEDPVSKVADSRLARLPCWNLQTVL